MFPQPKKYGPTIFGVVALVFAFNNPEKAAQFINQAFEAIERFANALG